MMRPIVVSADTESPQPWILAEAAAVIRSGGIVGFPTETFYGLGAQAWCSEAVRRICAVKGRPAAKPILVLVDSVAMAESLVEEIPSQARSLMDQYWPGPLTLVFRARTNVPTELTAGTGTIGIRLPAHRIACGLVSAAATPVTAPSANLSAAPPPTTAHELRSSLGGHIDLIVDGGRTAGGPPTTLVDVTVHPYRVLRLGKVRL